MIENDKRAPVGSAPKDVTNKVETQYSSLIEDKDKDPFKMDSTFQRTFIY